MHLVKRAELQYNGRPNLKKYETCQNCGNKNDTITLEPSEYDITSFRSPTTVSYRAMEYTCQVNCGFCGEHGEWYGNDYMTTGRTYTMEQHRWGY